MQHQFDIDIATKYGVNAAILLNNLYFWCDKNQKNGRHAHDGLYWTYNSQDAFAKQFPYMTKRQIQTALKALIDDGMIVTGNFNTSPYDRTLWYAVTHRAELTMRKCEIESAEMQNRKRGNVPPIPDSNPDGNPDVFKVSKKENPSKATPSDVAKRQNFDALIDSYTDDSELREALRGFVQMRCVMRKRPTNRALELLFKKLDSLAGDTETKIAILNQSILNGWQGVFPLKDEESRKSEKKDDGPKPNWYYG